MNKTNKNNYDLEERTTVFTVVTKRLRNDYKVLWQQVQKLTLVFSKIAVDIK